MHNLDLILTATGGLSAALLLGFATQRIGLSPIVGYLLAGIVVGPYTPGFSADLALAEQLAEIGVILLMFGVGLQFHLNELLAVRNIVLPGALATSLVAVAAGSLVARVFGATGPAAAMFGLSLSVVSTVVLMRVLTDRNDLHTPAGRLTVGWTVAEDLFTVLVLVLLPMIAEAGLSASAIATAATLAAIKVAALIGFTFVVGGRAIPWLLERVSMTRSRELFTLTVLVIALGIAVGASLAFGVSMALGAFLAGLVVGRSEFSLRAANEAMPMRDAFAVLFFVSVGMLLDPSHLVRQPALIVATVAVILLAKPLAAFGIVRMRGYPIGTALSVGVALAQIGEFSFILSTLGRELGLLDASASNTIVAAAIVSITLNPVLYRLVGPVAARGARRRAARLASAADEEGPPPDRRHRAVVVGYGPTGRAIVRLLKANGVRPTVIDLNFEAIRGLREEGIDAVYGDATHRQTLMNAGVADAGTLMLSSASMHADVDVIRAARELSRRLRILARAGYLRDVPALRAAGADRVFAAEAEIALAITEAVLRELGATPEQIDRERDRVHGDLFGR